MSDVLKPDGKTDDDIEIVHIDDLAPTVTHAAEGEVIPTAASPTVEETVDTLKAQLAAETAARTRAEENANRAKADGVRFQNEAQAAKHAAISRALESATGALATAKASYKAAMEAGDYDAAGDAQIAMATHANNRQQLEAGKAQMEQALRQPLPKPVDAFEERVSAYNPTTQQWLRAHPDAITDPEKSAYVIAAHHRAIRAGKTEASPEYFDFIEQDVGYKAKQQVAAQPVRHANVSAPAGASARQPSGQKVNGAPFRMTARMRDAAAAAGVSEQAYAKQVQMGLAKGEDWATDLTRVN
jgi:hypothetical protein